VSHSQIAPGHSHLISGNQVRFADNFRIDNGGKRWVLTGPPSLFIADAQAANAAPAQLDLFGCEAEP
jgi:hypothetical protein